MGMFRTALIATAALLILAGPSNAGSASPAEYGRVIIGGASGKADLAPVVFDHWLHRAKYTCRLCHADIGFAMKANGTGITAADNMKGVYCGVCHNGKTAFPSCSADRSDIKRCERCHSQGKNVKRQIEFAAFTAKFPKDRYGNGINWEKTAEDGLIKPVDFLEGVSIKGPQRPIQQDFSIRPKEAGKAEIIFSHRKHVLWNGCEVCHPEIFMGGKRGETKYSMKEIEQGKFCGVCHTKVSFPLQDCGRCHSRPVN